MGLLKYILLDLMSRNQCYKVCIDIVRPFNIFDISALHFMNLEYKTKRPIFFKNVI